MTKTKEKINVTGDISIHTQNILPIIKKWLYSEQDIFIRELMSNAFDAIKKLKTISVKESLTDLQREGKIDLIPNEKENTLTIKDNGLGMTSEEIQKYINQIAFSGAEEFVAKYKDKEDGEQIIGQFGLGFYSAFMVSTLVEINTKSYKEGSQAVKWTCDGSTSFSIVESDKEDVGTEIILHLSDDAKEYLAEERLKNLVERFSNFLPVDIQVNGKTANNQNPIWIQQPSELKEEDYKKFYNVLFPFKGDPLFWIHLNVDYPFNLKGILYFPKIAHELDGNKGQVKLFCQQVFVTDNAKEILPEFLTLLQGAIDCPELPLNVSRSFLQQDPYVQKISKHIVKKVADKLIELHKNEKEQFEKHWEDINPFIKYGMMNDDSFYKKVENIVLFPSSSGNSTSLKEYTERNKEKL
ncbi:MAG: molecular chaperone HtpG, partial [Bdellovibrionales bacterium]|nr:molecular chaperone HtpG [Bdellovibrionales bacterium]